MATSFGIGPDQNGNGTTPDDIQVITGAEYVNAGILAGCKVTATSGMNYQIGAGAVVIQISTGKMVKAPVAAQTIPTTGAPATGSRTDIVYVKQNFPGTDGNNAVIVGVGSSVPSNAVEIGRMVIPAGATATNQGTPTGNTIYARPVGGMLGLLGSARDTDTTEHTTGTFTRGAMSFYVPTDRYIELSLVSCVSAGNDPATGYVLNETGSVFYRVYVDDILAFSFERPFTQYWDARHFETGYQVQAGQHTVKYTVERRHVLSGSSGKWKVRYGGADKFPGDFFCVTDRGVWMG